MNKNKKKIFYNKFSKVFFAKAPSDKPKRRLIPLDEYLKKQESLKLDKNKLN